VDFYLVYVFESEGSFFLFLFGRSRRYDVGQYGMTDRTGRTTSVWVVGRTSSNQRKLAAVERKRIRSVDSG